MAKACVIAGRCRRGTAVEGVSGPHRGGTPLPRSDGSIELGSLVGFAGCLTIQFAAVQVRPIRGNLGGCCLAIGGAP